MYQVQVALCDREEHSMQNGQEQILFKFSSSVVVGKDEMRTDENLAPNPSPRTAPSAGLSASKQGIAGAQPGQAPFK